MPEKTIFLSEFIIHKLDKEALDLTTTQRISNVNFLLVENIIRIFSTDEFRSAELESIVTEEKVGDWKVRNINLLLRHQEEEYIIKVDNAKNIVLTSKKTIPFFEIEINSHAIKNKIITQEDSEVKIEEQEIGIIEKYYCYKKRNISSNQPKKSFRLVPLNSSHKGFERFELINENETKEESAYFIERILNNLKENNLREIPIGEDEIANLREIFTILEEACTREEYKRNLDLN